MSDVILGGGGGGGGLSQVLAVESGVKQWDRGGGGEGIQRASVG